MGYFSEKDFNCFHSSKSKNALYNKKRLEIRRKLQTIGKTIKPFLENLDCYFEIKTSLHHPFLYNQYKVVSQWVYFVPCKEDLKNVKEIFGKDFFDELKSGYNHTVLLIGMDYDGLYVSLKTHVKAWWDGQNIKNKCKKSQFRQELRDLLRTADLFELRIHDFKKIYHCNKITLDELNMFLKYYSPGEHWLHLDYRVSREDSCIEEQLLIEKLKQLLVATIPIYKFIKWSPSNNYVFK
ncbi:hypothetical protein [Candidatus Uabimicrobium sp. HlEnr_7]|uniref:hypothetical protein n=1 Tax=Candidatus Uabimicrobium helgolandensis TaxID=3095367 RepID=UPI0035581420